MTNNSDIPTPGSVVHEDRAQRFKGRVQLLGRPFSVRARAIDRYHSESQAAVGIPFILQTENPRRWHTAELVERPKDSR